MTTWTKKRIAETLADHENWLTGDGRGRANLQRADLKCADLKCANLKCADLQGADLQGANLRDAALRYVNLRGVNLRDADLRDAVLGCADLRGVNLRNVILRGADLRGAVLECADLRGASLWGVIGNMAEIKSLQITTWPVTYTAERLQIGCENHRIEKWWGFTDEEIDRMDILALGWWQEWKEPLRKIIETSPAVPTGHEGAMP